MSPGTKESRSHMIPFLYEMSRTGKLYVISMQTDSRLVVAGGWGEQEWGVTIDG